jgi:hypothetical protein
VCPPFLRLTVTCIDAGLLDLGARLLLGEESDDVHAAVFGRLPQSGSEERSHGLVVDAGD